jgi:hypothetical protein
LTASFAADGQKQRQWRALVENVAHDPGDLAEIVRDLADFLMLHAASAARLRR